MQAYARGGGGGGGGYLVRVGSSLLDRSRWRWTADYYMMALLALVDVHTGLFMTRRRRPRRRRRLNSIAIALFSPCIARHPTTTFSSLSHISPSFLREKRTRRRRRTRLGCERIYWIGRPCKCVDRERGTPSLSSVLSFSLSKQQQQ